MTGSADGADGTPVPLAWSIVGGGAVSAEEIAALAVALTPVPAPPVESHQDDADVAQQSAWARAAIIEGIGGRPPASMQDLVQGRFGLGHVGDPAGQR